jgi:ribosomal protein S18 acetylase RimI-like enzyme
MAQESFDELLPEGPVTPSQFLFTVEGETHGEKGGMLWFGVEEREAGSRAFLYDIRIEEAYRRRGYGTQGLVALKAIVRELGLTRITLHVFGHNHPVRAMYAKLGYEEVDLRLSKTLHP